MVKDACVGEYYAIMESSSVILFFFKYYLSIWGKLSVWQRENYACDLLSKLPSNFALNVKRF